MAESRQHRREKKKFHCFSAIICGKLLRADE
jgi:hypothetical protein